MLQALLSKATWFPHRFLLIPRQVRSHDISFPSHSRLILQSFPGHSSRKTSDFQPPSNALPQSSSAYNPPYQPTPQGSVQAYPVIQMPQVHNTGSSSTGLPPVMVPRSESVQMPDHRNNIPPPSPGPYSNYAPPGPFVSQDARDHQNRAFFYSLIYTDS